jgi:hypothetical protein
MGGFDSPRKTTIDIFLLDVYFGLIYERECLANLRFDD